MRKDSLIQHLFIDDYSATPKYLQLANAIMNAIAAGKIKKDEILPSINELSFAFEMSRDTAEKGYRHLKKMGVLGAVPGKGFFVLSADLPQPIKIFLLFNKLSPHKKIIYDAFVAALGETASIDFYIYNNNFALFKKLVQNSKDRYTHYVIIPHFMDGGEDAYEVINELPKEKLILLDILVPGVLGSYGAVYEHFEKDIYDALEQALERLSKYHTINIIFPAYSYHPKEILKGFFRFCHQYAFNSRVIHDLDAETIKEGSVYINLMENDLVLLIEKILAARLKVGEQVGVISYNETPMKKIILEGITTMSTNFQLMGEQAAQLVLQHSKEHIAIPFQLTLRPSL